VEGSDGLLYGTAYHGGTNNAGVVFRLNKDGTGYKALHSFRSDCFDGQNPQAELVEGSDGGLYGTTSTGGAYGAGTVFRLTKDGTSYGVLHSFGSSPNDGQNPWAPLLQGSDGALYGTTFVGGTNTSDYWEGWGTVFKLNPDGTRYRVLHNFGNGAGDGKTPEGGVTQGSDGALYGTTAGGGTNTYSSACGCSLGTVFRLNKDGSNYSVLLGFPGYGFAGFDFFAADWGARGTRLLQGDDGSLYGARATGGSETNSLGTVFKLNRDGSGYTALHEFIWGGTDGVVAEGLLLGSDGLLYGTTAAGGGAGWGTLFSLGQDGTNYSQLRSFARASPDGRSTYAGLIQGPDGAFYGATFAGGTSGSGTVFRLSQDGAGYSILHSLSAGEGSNPQGGLLAGGDGMLYGTTTSGGAAGGGAVFKLNPDGTGYSILHHFDTNGGDGNFPIGGMVEGRDGALYGTTLKGGSKGTGTVFKLSKDGSGYSILYNFVGNTNGDGAFPNGGVIEATNGVLYGTTGGGGTNNQGTVFSLSRDGSDYSLLHLFGMSTGDGAGPTAGPVQASDGVLYGVTGGGGTNRSYNGSTPGTVFALNTDGSGYRVIHSFDATNGAGPWAGLVEGADGALYGTTPLGGSNDVGVVFKLNKDGRGYSVLHHFGSSGADGICVFNDATSNGDGQSPFSGLARGSDGAFYGTTDSGGDLGFGTVFKIWPPQTPDLIGATDGLDGVLVTFAGISGYVYQVLRSADLISWLVLTNITMPTGGVYTYIDNTPVFPAAYYRAAWLQ
jgi:uncharacterized repeat protein (TIGR03803 family)